MLTIFSGMMLVSNSFSIASSNVIETSHLSINNTHTNNNSNVSALTLDTHDHADGTWDVLTTSNASTTLESGNYYLTSDLTLSNYLGVARENEVNLCLNGNILTVDSDYLAHPIRVNSEATFSLYDCQDGLTSNSYNGTSYTSGLIVTSNTNTYLTTVSLGIDATFNMYGGTITYPYLSTNNALGVIRLTDNNTLNIFGGSIKDSYIPLVYTDYDYSSINIYGGTFLNNSSTLGDFYLSGVDIDVSIYGGTFVSGSSYLITGDEYSSNISLYISINKDNSYYPYIDGSIDTTYVENISITGGYFSTGSVEDLTVLNNLLVDNTYHVASIGSTVDDSNFVSGYTYAVHDDSNLTYFDEVAATCVLEGVDEYYECSLCNNKYSFADSRYYYETDDSLATPIDPNNHSYQPQEVDEYTHIYQCIYDGAEGDIEDHSFGEYVLTKVATIDEDGEYTRTCSICEYQEVTTYKCDEELPFDVQSDNDSGSISVIIILVCLLILLIIVFLILLIVSKRKKKEKNKLNKKGE